MRRSRVRTGSIIQARQMDQRGASRCWRLFLRWIRCATLAFARLFECGYCSLRFSGKEERTPMRVERVRFLDRKLLDLAPFNILVAICCESSLGFRDKLV